VRVGISLSPSQGGIYEADFNGAADEDDEHSSRGVEFGGFFRCERQARRRYVFFMMGNPERPGNQQDDARRGPRPPDVSCHGPIRKR
jgi:hypothetical protein